MPNRPLIMGIFMTTITLIGPGAIGLSVGMALIDAGHNVTFVSRQPFTAITLTAPDGTVRTQPIKVVAAKDAPVADWVLLCVKAHQVASAADALQACVGSQTRVAVLQNGVEHRENVAPYVSVPIVPVVVDVPSSKLGTGAASWRSPARMAAQNDADGRAFCDLFTGTFIATTVSDDLLTTMWRKLCVNAGGGAVLCLTGKPMKVFHEPGVADVARAILTECVAVGRAAGAKLDDSVIEEQMQRWLAAGPEETNSMLDDFRAGRPTEWNARNGVLVRKGREYGVATPVSDLLVPLLAAQK